MNSRKVALLALLLVIVITVPAAAQRATAPKKNAPPSPLVERVGDVGFIQLQAPSFAQLAPEQKALAYWLSQASIAIDPIIYDQLSRFGLREKRLLEALIAHPEGVKPEVRAKIIAYTKLFWANKGNHNDNTAQKFLPEFT